MQRQRIDKWIWFARVVRTRGLAAQLVEAGHVRLNGNRVNAAAHAIDPGDVLTIALNRQVRVLRVVAAGTHRGPYPKARLLFDDLTESGHAGTPPRASCHAVGKRLANRHIAGLCPATNSEAGPCPATNSRMPARQAGEDRSL